MDVRAFGADITLGTGIGVVRISARSLECGAGACYFCGAGPEWRNWQTRRTQNPVAARPCGFDPLLRDQQITA
jgi:histone acetyltransferase (RNA polymerase elongator complex component)